MHVRACVCVYGVYENRALRDKKTQVENAHGANHSHVHEHMHNDAVAVLVMYAEWFDYEWCIQNMIMLHI